MERSLPTKEVYVVNRQNIVVLRKLSVAVEVSA